MSIKITLLILACLLTGCQAASNAWNYEGDDTGSRLKRIEREQNSIPSSRARAKERGGVWFSE